MKPQVQIKRNDALPAISVEDVSFTYRDAERPALRGTTFALAPGEMIGVMGASGAGKSTLAKCLNRIVPEFEDGDFTGVIRIAGDDLASMRVCEAAPRIGMVFQDFEAQLFSTNVAHEVAFAMEQVGMERATMATRIAPALAAVGLDGFDARDPTSLSGGEKQRLAIASVLALSPSVIVLDEPTTDLDPEGKNEVFALIRSLRERGMGLIVIEHESEELRGADRLLILRQGEIVADASPAEVLTQFGLLEDSGVRPPGLNHLLSLLDIPVHAESVEHAHTEIVRKFPRLDTISHDSDATVVAPIETSSESHVKIENLSFNYPNGPRVLDSVDLSIAPGDFLAIVGQNGSGKSTLAKHIVGLLEPVAGRVLIDGRDRATMNPAETAHEAAYVFQNPDHQIFSATVEDEVAFGPRNFKLAPDEIARRCDEVLGAVGLQALRQSDPFLLSKGERQRLAVASVLALRPRLLILDEPTTGLDHREQLKMMALVSELNRSGIAIVIISHTPWLVAEYARRVVLMRKGRKLFDGGVREFFANDELLAGSSFLPPEVTQLSRRFGTLALSPAELAAWIGERA